MENQKKSHDYLRNWIPSGYADCRISESRYFALLLPAGHAIYCVSDRSRGIYGFGRYELHENRPNAYEIPFWPASWLCLHAKRREPIHRCLWKDLDTRRGWLVLQPFRGRA